MSAHSRFAPWFLALPLALACQEQNVDPPNLVLVVIDTLRPDHLSLYGYGRETSPHLDRLADTSVVMEASFSNSPWTKPSIGSLFTSLHPSQHGAVEFATENHLAGSLTTLAEILAERGYSNAGFSENPHISRSTNFDQGFDSFQMKSGYSDQPPVLIKRAQAWMRERDPKRPFFLYLHFLDPHGPYQPEHSQGFLKEQSTQDEEVRNGLVSDLVDEGGLSRPLTAEDGEYLKALYDAEIHSTDRELRQVVKMLESSGEFENTVLVITSDHGEEFLDHGGLRHGYWLYEENLHVPLILRAPGLEGGRVDAPVEHLDIAPTILDLLSIPIPSQFQGRSFVPLLRGEDLPRLPHVAQTQLRGIDIDSIRSGQWKLIIDRMLDTRELYDMQADPEERKNLAAAHPERVVQLEALLEQRTRMPAGVVLEGSFGEGNEEAEASLRQIGYIGEE